MLTRSDYRHLDRELTFKTRARDHGFSAGNFHKTHAFVFRDQRRLSVLRSGEMEAMVVVSVLSEALKSCQLKSCARIEQLDNHSPTNRCVQTSYFVSGLRCHSRRKLLVHLSSCKTLSSLWQQVLQVVDRPSRKSIVQHILRIPGFLRFILTLPRERLLWSSFPTPRSQCGFWEREVLGKWVAVSLKKTRLSGSAARGREYLDMKYIETFRVSKVVFSWLLQLCRARLEFETTNMRCSVSPEKRLAILLHWLGHGFAERQLATLYRVGPATVNGILHSGVEAVMTCLVPISIRFPVGQALHDQMLEFEEVSGLPLCAGAVDGTFMRIRKPVQWGDQYWCYKSFPAIIVLAVVNARGHYTFVDAGRAGSLGDAFTFNHSRLKANIDNGKWLVGETQVVNGKILKPYIVGDSAFALSPSLMKAFPHPAPPGRRKRLNAAVCRARKIVEQSFGDTKGRFKILSRASFNDPNYAAKVAVVCCALHNVCMYANDCNELRYVPDPDLYVAGCGPMFGPISTALHIQSALSTIA